MTDAHPGRPEPTGTHPEGVDPTGLGSGATTGPGGAGSAAGPGRRRGIGRRGLLGLAGASLVAGTAGAVAGRSLAPGGGASGAATPGDTYPFHGDHQSGIVTPAQDRMHFAAFDLTTRSRGDLVALLAAWTRAAVELTAGHPVGGDPVPYDAPPHDTGEAAGLRAGRLTLTFGFGPTLFRDAAGRDRFGLAARQPAALRRLPHFPADRLDPRRSDGDLCVQACADDPQVAVHAVRNLSRLAFGTAAIRWSQLGFGRTASTSAAQDTPRNLFGFKDGTANVKAEDGDLLRDHVWVGPGDDPAADWLAGGSYLVARRIAMNLETWDRASLREQEAIVGRNRGDGAPLSGGTEFSEPDFAVRGRGDAPVIAANSHVGLAHPSHNGGARMLRRGYNFADGTDDLGRLDAGLFFIAYVRDPRRGYIPMQTRMSRQDAMQEYLQHRGSALFAVPAGVAPGEFVGQALFA